MPKKITRKKIKLGHVSKHMLRHKVRSVSSRSSGGHHRHAPKGRGTLLPYDAYTPVLPKRGGHIGDHYGNYSD